MKRVLLMLGVVMFSLSAEKGVAYADSGFLSAVKQMVANVAQRSDLVGAVSYVMNDTPSHAASELPTSANEWAGELGYTVQLNPKLAAFSTLEMGIDNRILRTKFGVSRALWAGKKP